MLGVVANQFVIGRYARRTLNQRVAGLATGTGGEGTMSDPEVIPARHDRLAHLTSSFYDMYFLIAIISIAMICFHVKGKCPEETESAGKRTRVHHDRAATTPVEPAVVEAMLPNFHRRRADGDALAPPLYYNDAATRRG